MHRRRARRSGSPRCPPAPGSRSRRSRSPKEGVITLADGRRLAWADWGEPDGRPLLRLHGSPGSRLQRNPDEDLPRRARARVVTFDRPGYGLSTRAEGRTFLSWAEDALDLADHLSFETFSILGISGGGPHALALGLRAPERIHRVGVVGTATPPEWFPEFEDEVLKINRQGRARALEGRESLRMFLAPVAERLLEDPTAPQADAPPPDREPRDEADQAVAQENVREALRQGLDGWIDEACLFSEPWGFDPAAVGVPVFLWHGELDRNTPLKAVQRLASELPEAHLTVLRGEGHRGWLEHEEEMLELLLDKALPTSSPRRA